MSAHCHVTRKRPWQRQSKPGAERDSFSCLGMGLTGTGSGACWAETVQRESREIFLVLFMNGYQEHDLIKMYLFINLGGKLTWKKIQIDNIIDILGEVWLNKLSKVFFLPFFQVPDTAQLIQAGPGTSLCSLSRLSLPSRPHSLFPLDPSRTRAGISLCSRHRLSQPSRGLFLVR